jgi:hypothetical protein
MKRWINMLMFCGAILALATVVVAAETPSADQKKSVAPAIVAGTGFEGRVVVDGAVLPGARVYAYHTFADFTASKPFAASALTGDDGKYMLDLPVGSYYLVAKKRPQMTTDSVVAAGDFFSFQGSNPITVAAGKYTHVGFSMLPYAQTISYQPYDTNDSGGIAGVVTLDGKPLDGVYVTLYVDAAEDLRGSTYATSPPTGKSGVFRFDYLPEVEYFVVARKRAIGGAAGPLSDGDYFGFFPANPVHVKAGKLAQLEVAVNTKAGEIGKEDSLFRPTGTAVTGLIRDLKGKPVAGVYVFAYLEKVMAHKRPEFISAVVDKDGRYVLNLPEGGTYYLGARSKYGDTPALGEWYGRWEGTGDHSVVLKSGETLKAIDITVEEILP